MCWPLKSDGMGTSKSVGKRIAINDAIGDTIPVYNRWEQPRLSRFETNGRISQTATCSNRSGNLRVTEMMFYRKIRLMGHLTRFAILYCQTMNNP